MPAVIVVAAAGVAALALGGGGESDEDLQAGLHEELCALTDEEQEVMDELVDVLGEEGDFQGCEVEVDGDVVTIQIGGFYSDSEKLQSVGEQQGWWSAADVQRMLTTRALDGTQDTNDGQTTWTYHPDNGLQIIAER